MDAAKCKACQHFRQHYTVDKAGYRAIGCGHCVTPRLKHRKPEESVCSFFVPRCSDDLPDRQEVVHFLTTEMLQFILQLELPPENAE